MAITMQYRWLLIPAGLLAISAGFVLYFRERRRCTMLGCRMAGSGVTLALLIAASAVVGASIVLDRFPDATAEALARLTSDGHGAAGHDVGGRGLR
jgi:hypothetical protein